MPITWTNISYPFTQGLSQVWDDKVRPIGKMETLENASFDTLGGIGKRNGWQAQTRYVQEGDSVAEGTMLEPTNLFSTEDSVYISAYRDDSFWDIYKGPKMFQYSPGLDAWLDRGSYLPNRVTVRQMNSDSGEDGWTYHAHTDNYTGVIYSDTESEVAGGEEVYFGVFEKGTDVPIRRFTDILDPKGRKIVGRSDRISFFHADGATLVGYTWSESDPLGTLPVSNPATDLHADALFDVWVGPSDKLFLAYKNTASGITVKEFPLASWTPTNSYSILAATATPDNILSISPATTAIDDDQFVLAWQDSTTYDVDATLSTSSAVVGSIWTVQTYIVSNTIVAVTGVDDNYERLSFFIDVDNRVDVRTSNYTGGGAVSSYPAYNMRLGSKAFSIPATSTAGSTIPLVWFYHNSTEQGGMYLYSPKSSYSDQPEGSLGAPGLGQFLSKALYQSAALQLEQNNPPPVQLESTGIYTIGCSVGTIVDAGGLREYPSLISLDVNNSTLINSVDLPDGGTLLSGGIVSRLDSGVYEESIQMYPELKTAITNTPSGGGPIVAGTYGISAVYEWRDSVGNLHRSAPATTTSYVVSADSSSITVQYRTLPVWLAHHEGSLVRCIVYRTEKDGSILYREDSGMIDGQSDVNTFFLSATDAELADNRVLYTEGGELGHIAPPPSKFLWRNNDRVFSISSDSNSIWYSKPFVEGLSVEFHPNLSITIAKDAVGGADMDGRQIVFFEDSIKWFGGAGPNNLGVGSFSPLSLIPTSRIGCSEPKSILSTSEGIIFKSTNKGFYLLDRSLTLTPIGLDVEDYDRFTVIESILDEDDLNAHFMIRDGSASVITWNLLTKQWTILSPRKWGNGSSDSEIGLATLNGDQYALTEGPSDVPTLHKEVTSSFDTALPLKIVTGWIPMTETGQGYVRVRRINLLGRNLNDHILTLKI